MKLIAESGKCRLTATKGLLVGFALSIAQIAPVAAADPAEKFDAVREFTEVYEQLKSRYVEGLDDKKLVASAIQGMLSTLDPFSDYLEPEAYEELRQETGGVFGGLGMEVALEKGGVKIVSAMEDSPAARAGLQVGDLITRLGETRVEGLTLEQAIQHARGAPDTSIALTVLSMGQTEPRVVTVKRAIIQARSVKAAAMDNGYFYLKITHFHKQTAENMLAALTSAYQQSGELKGVVLDLRDNPGGVLKSAVAVSSAFLPEDSLVVYTDSASEKSRMRLVTKPVVAAGAGSIPDGLRTALQNVPVVVLVNGGSASAAEIVAGALQSYGRATILGTKTFGKGSVQMVAPLTSGAALKLTTAYYHTPDGRRIQGVGVVPDIAVEQSPVQELARAEASATKTAERARGPSVVPAQGDYQFERALEFLRNLPVLVES